MTAKSHKDSYLRGKIIAISNDVDSLLIVKN